MLGSTELTMFFMPVLCSTLGLCWMASWVRGEMGECWWEWEWEAGRLPPLPPPLPPPPPLLCSVPGGNKPWGQRDGPRAAAGTPGVRAGGSDVLPGLQMGACSTVVADARMDFSRSRSRSRSLSDEAEAVGFVK